MFGFVWFFVMLESAVWSALWSFGRSVAVWLVRPVAVWAVRLVAVWLVRPFVYAF